MKRRRFFGYSSALAAQEGGHAQIVLFTAHGLAGGGCGGHGRNLRHGRLISGGRAILGRSGLLLRHGGVRRHKGVDALLSLGPGGAGGEGIGVIGVEGRGGILGDGLRGGAMLIGIDGGAGGAIYAGHRARAGALAEAAPFTADYAPLDGKAAYYVCTGGVCKLPVTEL